VIASEFEYRHRFAIVAFVFVFAYAFYNLDPLNIVYAIVPRDLGVLNQDILARFVYSVSALLAGIGAALLTWASASRLSSPGSDLPMGGPYRYVRNPHFIGYFLLVVGLGSFQSRAGFPILIAHCGGWRVATLAPSLLASGIPMGPGGYIGRLCLHVERSRWVHVRMCNALVLSSAKASTAALDSHASYLTTVLSSSAASVPPDFTSDLAWIIHEVSSQKRKDALKG